MAGEIHEEEARTIIYVRCTCKWEWRNEKLRGKKDEDLNVETQKKFDDHRRKAQDRW